MTLHREAPTPGGETVTVRIPFAFHRRGGRKLIIAADGSATTTSSPAAHQKPRIDNALVKALARAHRWQNLIETGVYASISELAEAERINLTYLCRVLRLTLLAPDLVEAILDGRQPFGMKLEDLLLRPFPVEWELQRRPLNFRTEL